MRPRPISVRLGPGTLCRIWHSQDTVTQPTLHGPWVSHCCPHPLATPAQRIGIPREAYSSCHCPGHKPICGPQGSTCGAMQAHFRSSSACPKHSPTSLTSLWSPAVMIISRSLVRCPMRQPSYSDAGLAGDHPPPHTTAHCFPPPHNPSGTAPLLHCIHCTAFGVVMVGGRSPCAQLLACGLHT